MLFFGWVIWLLWSRSKVSGEGVGQSVSWFSGSFLSSAQRLIQSRLVLCILVLGNVGYTYFNYFKYSDGTPTVSWNRSGVDEGLPIVDLLSKRIIEQHSSSMFKLTGVLSSDVFFGFFNSFFEQYTGKYHIPMGMSIEDKQRSYSVELQEVVPLTNNGGKDIGEFNSEEFDNSFDI